MRMLLLVALSAVALGCAHRDTHNLAQRQSVTTPRSDFAETPRDARSRHDVQPVEPPIVTPPVP